MLEKHLNEFVIAYLNNIIIYSNSKEEHFKYIKQVLQRLVNKKMLVAIKKYKFYIIKTAFYGFIIKLGKLSIDLKQVYHQIRIKEGDKQKAAFRLKKGLYKPLIIQFGFINIPAIF